MRLPFDFLYKSFLVGIGLTLIGAVNPCRADETTQTTAPPGDQTPAPPTATLHVTGTPTEFTIGADHADVQSMIKLIFDQAGKQFFLDNDVTGQVTLRLEAQPLRTVLEAVCKQTFLRYQVNLAGVYLFQRDDVAIQNFVARHDFLNRLLLQQLRLMGLDVPNSLLNGQAPGFNGNLGGGFGGGGGTMNFVPQISQLYTPADLVRKTLKIQQQPTADAVRRESHPQAGVAGGRAADSGSKSVSPEDRSPSAPGKAAPPSPGPQGPPGPTGNATNALEGGGQNQAPVDTRVSVQEGLIAIRIPKSQPEPITGLLQELSRQTNVPILIDRLVPSGAKFSFSGNLTTRTLPETLDLLGTAARLKWFWVNNNSIFVTTTPDFSIWVNSADTPRATVGGPVVQQQTSPPPQQQRSLSQPQGQTAAPNVAAPAGKPAASALTNKDAKKVQRAKKNLSKPSGNGQNGAGPKAL